jgi:immune inhibitor A
MSIKRNVVLPDQKQPELVSPHPALRAKLNREVNKLKRSATSNVVRHMMQIRRMNHPGMNDGLIVPGTEFPLGTSLNAVRAAALKRAPLQGTVRVIVTLVDFPDLAMKATKEHFHKLFFSIGEMPNGSVREFYREVSNKKIDIQGEIVGPYRLPQKLSVYAGGQNGTDNPIPNARTMAFDAVKAADADVNFSPYDNDGNGYVDAFIVIHAGKGGEETGNGNDIWSHKWVFSGGAYKADKTKVYAYLTVPENCKVGVCCHELGHLLFGWPDFYDTDYSSQGIGSWCLMSGGSWNGNGEIPSHPNAWCKAKQQWVSIVNNTGNATLTIDDVKDGKKAYRLWKNGEKGNEYFLLENRQLKLFDRCNPGAGLLIYHVDEAIEDNSNEYHPKIALMQADGLRNLETGANEGDEGDPFPGSKRNKKFDFKSDPSSKAYSGLDSLVSVSGISLSMGRIMAKIKIKK